MRTSIAKLSLLASVAAEVAVENANDDMGNSSSDSVPSDGGLPTKVLLGTAAAITIASVALIMKSRSSSGAAKLDAKSGGGAAAPLASSPQAQPDASKSAAKKGKARPNAAERQAAKEAAAAAAAEETAAEEARKAAAMEQAKKEAAAKAAAEEAAYEAELAAQAAKAKADLARAAKEKEEAKLQAKEQAKKEAAAKAAAAKEAADEQAAAQAAAKAANPPSADETAGEGDPAAATKPTAAAKKAAAKGGGSSKEAKAEAEKAEKLLAKTIEELKKASKNDDVKKAEAALDRGLVTVDYAEEGSGHTPLHRAAAFGALKVIRMLHARGASLEVLNGKKQTPLDVAEHIGEPKAAALLRALASGKSGDGIESEDDEGEDADN